MFLTKTANVPKIDMETINCKRALLLGLLEVVFIITMYDIYKVNNHMSFLVIL